MMFYYCPSLEAVKELLDMAIHHVCPCTSDDVFDNAWRQWIQLTFKSHQSKGTQIESLSSGNPSARSAGEQTEQFANSRTSSCSSVTADTVVRVLPTRYFLKFLSLIFVAMPHLVSSSVLHNQVN